MGYWDYYYYPKSTPKRVKGGIKTRAQRGEIGETWWAKVIKEMASQARHLAKLLAGEMTNDIEEVFKKAKVPLFPTSGKDFVADCSCPDWANPCKHIAAVYYIVGEAFDRAPFLIFHLRGQNREKLQKALHKEAGIVEKEISADAEQEVKEIIVEPLSCDPNVFYKQKQKLEHHFSLKLPSLNAAILYRLGAPQFWPGTEKEFYEKWGGIYKKVSETALKIAYASQEESKNQDTS